MNITLPCEIVELLQNTERKLVENPSIQAFEDISLCLEKLDGNVVLNFLKEISEDLNMASRICASSYLQGNGFLKILLHIGQNFDLRLHIWNSENQYQENVHDHRWYLASKVVYGQIGMNLWKDDISKYSKTYKEFIYIGKDVPVEHIGTARIMLSNRISLTRGQAYYLEPNALHQVTLSKGDVGVTLMIKSKNVKKQGRIIPTKSLYPETLPNPMSGQELSAAINKVLNKITMDV